MINKRKINLRVYILIICEKENKKLYLYNNGKCIYTNKDYDNSLDIEANFTSVNLDYNIYGKNPIDFNELKSYFLKNNISFTKIWNDIKKLILDTYLSFYDQICINKSIKKNFKFQLFGIDIILDKKLKLYLLEINKGPSLKINFDKEEILKKKLFDDIFSLIYYLNKQKSNNGNYNNFELLN